GPWPPGCDVRTMAFGCLRFGFSTVTDAPSRSAPSDRSGHPGGVRLERPLGGDLLQITPELDAAAAGDVAVPELGIACAAERERLARNGDAHVDAHHAA